MTFISKTAGAVGLISCIHDIHKTAMIDSNNAYARASANAIISNSLGNQKADSVSFRDAQRKNWLTQGQFFVPIKETCARIGGYVKGVVKASTRYIPNFVLAGIALGCKSNNRVANAAAIGLGVIEGLDIVKHATNINQRTDYLK